MQSNLRKAALLTVSLVLFHLVVGVAFRSQSSINECLKRLVDLFCIVLLLCSVAVSARPPTRAFPYGLGKAEPLACLANVIVVYISVLHFLLDTAMPDDSTDAWYEDTNDEIMVVYCVVVMYYLLLRVLANRRHGARVQVAPLEEERVGLQGPGGHPRQSTPDQAEPPHPVLCCVCEHPRLAAWALNFRICASTLLYLHELVSLAITESEVDTDGTYQYAFMVLWAIIIASFVLASSVGLIRRTTTILLDGFTDSGLFLRIKKDFQARGVSPQ